MADTRVRSPVHWACSMLSGQEADIRVRGVSPACQGWDTVRPKADSPKRRLVVRAAVIERKPHFRGVVIAVISPRRRKRRSIGTRWGARGVSRRLATRNCRRNGEGQTAVELPAIHSQLLGPGGTVLTEKQLNQASSPYVVGWPIDARPHNPIFRMAKSWRKHEFCPIQRLDEPTEPAIRRQAGDPYDRSWSRYHVEGSLPLDRQGPPRIPYHCEGR